MLPESLAGAGTGSPRIPWSAALQHCKSIS